MTETESPANGEDRVHAGLILIFAIIFVGGVVDLVLDAPTELLSLHVLFEVTMVGVSLGAIWYFGSHWYRAQALSRALAVTAEKRKAERDAWRLRAEQALGGLGRALVKQFDEWGLTPAERETALMLLKGFSHKRIARLTERSERTVRQHAVAVYRKAGLAGRAELAGFFLGDLTLYDAETPE
jgi:DNA-binding CsgD family transcriptional regulator